MSRRDASGLKCLPPFVELEMEEARGAPMAMGSRQVDLKKSFMIAIGSLLTSCSKEEFCKAFPNFTVAEKERLHRLFIEVITSLHESMEDAFLSLCAEMKAGSILDLVEQYVEEQNLDPLFPEESIIGTVGKTVLDTKRDEIHYLTSVLEKAEEQKRQMTACLDQLRKARQNFSGVSAVVDKLRRDVQSYANAGTTGS